jgi:hypothetical protein
MILFRVCHTQILHCSTVTLRKCLQFRFALLAASLLALRHLVSNRTAFARFKLVL